MELTKKQEEGLKIAIDRYRNLEKYTVIAGYAGSGKSTLIKFIVSALINSCGVKEEDICFCAYTGKATQVLASKGNKNVSTLHKLLYTFRLLPTGKYIKIKKDHLDFSVIIVDEVSMAPKDMIELLFSYGVYVICCGDPFQLPPINDDMDNHLLDSPHVFLDEIMRQAKESSIIRLSMAIREGRGFSDCTGDDVRIYKKDELNTGMISWADQILCATNKTRKLLNNTARKILGYDSQYPQEGEKVICVRNYWDTISNFHNPLINGSIGYLNNLHSGSAILQVPFDVLTVGTITANFVADNGSNEFDDNFGALKINKDLISTEKTSLDAKTTYKVKDKEQIPKEFLYGYAITCWKAQGSQWNKVLFIEEGFPTDREEHARYLYTGVTRAIDKIIMITK